ncbi:MAG: transporter ATP-binding protein [Burkholderiales bacterium]|jgi:ABC-type Mn2+/Zn2+ transport system ATPase subunit|nr:transporter ATP-binding protein [Burkholderiales bacterium]
MIECRNLVLGHNGKPISERFNLSLPNNKWFGIIGENGCGKSTFMKTILGNIKPISGNLTVLGNAPGGSNDSIAYIPQEREINASEHTSGLTLIELSYNGWHFGIPFLNSTIKKKALDILKLVGATKYMHQPFNTLSGGQKKRIYLAQALINRPKLLLLDEPLADLDPEAKQHFIEAMGKIHQEHELTLLIISHDMHEIAMNLNGYIHFKQKQVHFCQELPCIREGVYVGL